MQTRQRYLFITIFVWFSFNTAMHAQQQPLYVLDVSSESSLKTIFDAGIRPTNVGGLELTKCEIRNSTIVFVGKQGLRVQIDAEQAEFYVAADGTLTEVFAETRNMTLSSALPEAVRLFGLFGTVPTNLNGVFRKAREARSFEPLREIGSGTGGEVEPGIGAGFVPGDFVPESPDELHVRIGVRVYWKSKVWRSKVRKEPIKPPAGYEQFSMEPVLSPSEVRRRRDMAAIAAAKTATPVPSTPVPTATPNVTSPPTTPVTQTPASASERKASVWPWLVGIVALTVVALLVWKRRA